jgi:hypothetical protein
LGPVADADRRGGAIGARVDRATDPRAERLLEALLIGEGYLSGGLRA